MTEEVDRFGQWAHVGLAAVAFPSSGTALPGDRHHRMMLNNLVHQCTVVPWLKLDLTCLDRASEIDSRVAHAPRAWMTHATPWRLPKSEDGRPGCLPRAVSTSTQQFHASLHHHSRRSLGLDNLWNCTTLHPRLRTIVYHARKPVIRLQERPAARLVLSSSPARSKPRLVEITPQHQTTSLQLPSSSFPHACMPTNPCKRSAID